MFNLTDSAPADVDHKSINAGYVLIAILLYAILILTLYLPTFKWLVHIWTIDEQYSHGFFVPLISIYFVWIKRDWFKNISINPSLLWGGLLILGSIVLLLVGRCGAFIHAESISFFFLLPGMVLFLFGWKFLNVFAMPLFYLQFMIPWLDPFFEKIQPIFQSISAVIGSRLLALKYPVFSDNIYIHLPNISMVVARECSGINFLVSILAIGLPLVYLTQKTWTKALVILLIGCLICIFSNGLRVAIAGVMGEEFGPQMLHGPAHIFEGWFVAWVGWAGLFIVNWYVGKIPFKNGEPQYRLYERWRSRGYGGSVSNGLKTLYLNFYALLFILLIFSAYLNFYAVPRPVSINVPLDTIPVKVAGWQGIQSDWFNQERYFPKLDNKLTRVYRNQSGNLVYLFVGYYAKQDNDKRLISFLSKPLNDNQKIINIMSGQKSCEVATSFLRVGTSNLATLFWYQLPVKMKLTDRLQVKLHVLKTGILQRQTNGAIVLLATPVIPGGDNNMESVQAMQSFFAAITPVLDELLP